MPLNVGGRLGPYEIVGTLGAGGMGEVYRARDTKLGREVALKVLPEVFVADRERIARFRREAQVLASLNHPNIGGIYGLEDSDVTQALVLELVEGPTLADRITQGRLPLDEALPIARQVAEALETAHEQGIVHRDLKPANIKLRPDGTVKILDFGLARALAPTAVEAPGVSLTPTITSPALVTSAGMILGTAAYMSPEQAKGHPADKRSDVWAFGCVLYELLTGKRAFEGEDVSETIAAVLRTVPDWEPLFHAAPGVRMLIQRCLEKDPRQRVSSLAVAKFLLDDRNTSTALTQQARPRTSITIRVLPIAVAMLGVALASTLALLWRPAEEAPLSRFQIVLPDAAQFGATGTLSPDGRHLAMIGRDRGQYRLWVRSFDSTGWRPLNGTDGANYAFWSPDSRELGFFVLEPARRLKKVDLLGATTEVITEVDGTAPLGGASWGADGTIIFTRSREEKGALVLALRPGAKQAVPVTTLGPEESTHVWPEFLPDGKRFIYFSRGLSPDNDAIYIASLGSDEKTRIVGATAMARFSTTGHLFFMRGSRLIAQAFDVGQLKVSGDPLVVAEPVGTTRWGSADFSVAGRVLAHWVSPEGTTGSRLVWRNQWGAELTAVADPAVYRTFAVSPDEKHVLAHVHDARSTTGNLWLIDMERKTTSRFTEGPMHDTRPLWAADGSRALYVSQPAQADRTRDNVGIWEKGVAASSRPTLVREIKGMVTLQGWSTDGQYVVFDHGDTGTFDVEAFDMSNPTRVIPLADSRFDERRVQLSPNGAWIAYQSNESGRHEIYVQSFPSRDLRFRVSTDGATEPRWAADGKSLYFISADERLMRVSISPGANPAVSAPTGLFQLNTSTQLDGTNHYWPSRDGSRFLVLEGSESNASAVDVTLNWLRLASLRP